MKIMICVMLLLFVVVAILLLVVKHLRGEIRLIKAQLEASEKEKDI